MPKLEMKVVPALTTINRGNRLALSIPVADILGAGDDVDVLGGEGSAVVVVGDGELRRALVDDDARVGGKDAVAFTRCQIERLVDAVQARYAIGFYRGEMIAGAGRRG